MADRLVEEVAHCGSERSGEDERRQNRVTREIFVQYAAARKLLGTSGATAMVIDEIVRRVATAQASGDRRGEKPGV